MEYRQFSGSTRQVKANPELVEQDGNYLAVLGLHSEVNAIPELVEPTLEPPHPPVDNHMWNQSTTIDRIVNRSRCPNQGTKPQRWSSESHNGGVQQPKESSHSPPILRKTPKYPHQATHETLFGCHIVWPGTPLGVTKKDNLSVKPGHIYI